MVARLHGKLSFPSTVASTGSSRSTLYRANDDGAAATADDDDDDNDDDDEDDDDGAAGSDHHGAKKSNASCNSKRRIECRRGMFLFTFMYPLYWFFAPKHMTSESSLTR